jgi:hypothetical protein
MTGTRIDSGQLKTKGQLWFSAAGMWPSNTNGCTAAAIYETGTNNQDVYNLSFASGANQYCQGNLFMPTDWDASTVTAKFVWMANDATTHAAVWGAQGYAYATNTTLEQTWGTQQTVTSANNSTAYQTIFSSVTSAITIGGSPAASDLVLFRFERLGTNGSDTLTVAALLLGVLVTYGRV